MSIEYRRGALKPMACITEGYALIKERYWLMLGITLIGMMIGRAVPFNIIMGAMLCGIHYCLFRLERGKNVEFGMLFKGFDHFGPSVVAALLAQVPILLVTTPISIVAAVLFLQNIAQVPPGAPPPPGMFQNFMLLMFAMIAVTNVVALVVNALFMFAYPLIVDRKLSGVEAVKTSIKAALGNLGGVLVLVLLQGVLLFVGMMLCYIGMFFVLPINIAATAIAYQQVFGDEPTADEFSNNRTDAERDYLEE